MFAVVWLFCFVSAAVQISNTAKFEKRLKHTQNKDCIHVVGFSDLIYLWVIIRYLKKAYDPLCTQYIEMYCTLRKTQIMLPEQVKALFHCQNNKIV